MLVIEIQRIRRLKTMETNVRKILLRSLFSLFSILLIIILNHYLNYRLELIAEGNLQMQQETEQRADQPLRIMAAWDNYSPADMDPAVLGIDRRKGNNGLFEPTFPPIPEERKK
jgi:hypothetical protein